jgi:muramoyltetrapeptide carboxypeptidase LdcA involved in peptidoglycan recycling
VDFEKIKAAEPKWYMGYSDNTNFTFLLTTLCDVASIYGPCAGTFGMEPWHPSVQDAFALMTGEKQSVSGYDGWEKESLKDEEHPLEPYNITEKRVLKVYDPSTGTITEQGKVTVSGRLIGGCLDCLDMLVGTKFDKVPAFAEKYKEEGILWFLEACDLNVMSIRRAIWQLEHSGWFKYTKGFLIGRPLCMGQELMGLDQYSAVTGVLSKYNVPIIMDADVGHFAPMMPLVCGSLATIWVDGNDIQIEMK